MWTWWTPDPEITRARVVRWLGLEKESETRTNWSTDQIDYRHWRARLYFCICSDRSSMQLPLNCHDGWTLLRIIVLTCSLDLTSNNRETQIIYDVGWQLELWVMVIDWQFNGQGQQRPSSRFRSAPRPVPWPTTLREPGNSPKMEPALKHGVNHVNHTLWVSVCHESYLDLFVCCQNGDLGTLWYLHSLIK